MPVYGRSLPPGHYRPAARQGVYICAPSFTRCSSSSSSYYYSSSSSSYSYSSSSYSSSSSSSISPLPPGVVLGVDSQLAYWDLVEGGHLRTLVTLTSMSNTLTAFKRPKIHIVAFPVIICNFF